MDSVQQAGDYLHHLLTTSRRPRDPDTRFEYFLALCYLAKWGQLTHGAARRACDILRVWGECGRRICPLCDAAFPGNTAFFRGGLCRWCADAV